MTTSKDQNIEPVPGLSGDTHDNLRQLGTDILKNPCHCLEQVSDQNCCVSPYTKEHYDRVRDRITRVIEDMQAKENILYQRLTESHLGEGEADVLRMIATLAQPGPVYTERNGKIHVQTNPKAQYLLPFNLIPGLINGQMPVVTVNALNILRDVNRLNKLIRIHDNNPKATTFLHDLKTLLLSYGETIDPVHMDLERNKSKRLNGETMKAFGKMGRATAFVLFAAGTLLTGIMSIFGNQSPTAAVLYGALAFLAANKGILTPKEDRDVDLAISVLEQTGLHGAEGSEKHSLALLCQSIFNSKNDDTTKKLLRKPKLTSEELKTLTVSLTHNNDAAAKYLTTKSQRDGLASLFTLSKGARKHIEGYIDRVRSGQKTT